jgi:hypothetical protein
VRPMRIKLRVEKGGTLWYDGGDITDIYHERSPCPV